MALQRIPGCNNHWLVEAPKIYPGFTSVLLDAAADRIAMAGRFVHQSNTTQTVDGIEFSFGPVNKTNLSTFQVSLQNVDLVNGPPVRGDGVADQTLTIANADTGFVTNTWYGGDFDGAATRSLAIGEVVVVVFQFGAFFAGDSVNIRGVYDLNPLYVFDNLSGVTANLTGSYVRVGMMANLVLRCSDGTFGTLSNAWPMSVSFVDNIHSGTSPDEVAIGVQLPFPYATDGMWMQVGNAPSAQVAELILYDGVTALKTVSIDYNTLMNADLAPGMVAYPEQVHTKDTLYRVAVRPTTINACGVLYTGVNEIGHLTCLPGGAAFHMWMRTNQGAWDVDYPLRRPLAGIRLSAFDDGVGGIGQGLHTIAAQVSA